MEQKLHSANEAEDYLKAEMKELKKMVAALTSEVGELRRQKTEEAGPKARVAASFADIVKSQLPKMVKEAAKTAVNGAAVAASHEDNRLRTVVIDGLPEAANPEGDRTNLSRLLSDLRVPDGAVGFRRLGKRPRGEAHRPRKVKIQLASQDLARQLLTPGLRRSLRSPEWEERLPGLFISPARTKQERKELFLLRRRRDELNKAAEEAKRADNRLPTHKWILDSQRAVLILSINGIVDRTIRDKPKDERKDGESGAGPPESAP